MDRTTILLLADSFRRRKKRGVTLPASKFRLPVEITARLVGRASELDVSQADIVTAALAVALPEQPNAASKAASNTVDATGPARSMVAAPGRRSEGEAP